MQASGDFQTLICSDNMIVAVILHPIWGSRVPPERKLLFSQGRVWAAWTKIVLESFLFEIELSNFLQWLLGP